MKTPQLLNYERDNWVAGNGELAGIASAIDGAPVATTGSGGLDFGAKRSARRSWCARRSCTRSTI
jgi:hypothetical protein